VTDRRALPIYGASARKSPDMLEVRDVDREARPYYVVWEITLRCDLACRHCGSRAGKARSDELDTREALDLVAQLADLGTREITLIGGEVYLRDDWLVIARAIVDRGMKLGVATGGRGLTRDRAAALRDLGIRSIGVSIDGLPESHDDLRAMKGSHAAAMEALGHLAALGIARSVNTQINARNLHEIEELWELLRPTGIRAWQVQMTVAMGRAADAPDVLLQPYQMLELLPLVGRLKTKTDAAGVRLWPGSNIGYFGPYESMLRQDAHGDHHDACPAGRHGMGIEANGDIKGCPSLPTSAYVGGNVRDRSLRDIWLQSRELRFTRARPVDELWGHCRSCYYAEDCLGGCTWTSHVLFGRRGNNPYCHHRALELLQRGVRERLVPRVAPSGEPFDHGLFDLVEEPWPEPEMARAREIGETGAGFL
jgi:radical SAM protein with 4Fe4S-binding SPASM domain